MDNSFVSQFKKNNLRKIIILVSLVVLILISFIVDLFTGAANLSFIDTLKALFAPSSVEQSTLIIIRNLRLPISLMAIMIGLSLGTSGSVMQTILHNPLASPYTLGIGAGASFGASLGILLGANNYVIALLSFVFAMSISLFIYLLGRFTNMSTHTMTLTGIALLFLFQALQSFLQYMASENQNQQIVFWTFGSLQKVDYIKLLILTIAFVIVFPLLMRNSWKYTALTLGSQKAQSLGIKTNALKLESFILISIIASLSVCFTGPIGFIGIAGPHIARSLVGEDHRFYIPCSALIGALILTIADILSKLVNPGSIFPIGIITSIIGVPFFFAILIRGRK
ncbi:MAG: iron ABC transporter permease [Bacilli bacterium]|jgi:iron complex transport system permease protein|nr:iron ABC transporter permease [Bacilli bacterium]